jgi:hypothetical protein
MNKSSFLFIDNNTSNITSEYNPPIPPAVEKPKAKPKTQYAEFVSMTEAEYSALVTKLGEAGAERCVELLDNYKGANGKKYASDYRAILNWVVKRYDEENAKQGGRKGTNGNQRDYSNYDF